MTGQKTILVIDDEPDILDFLTTLLKDNGYNVMTASNGQEGQEAMKKARPDLVSLDVSMPEKTGVKFYRELKSDPATSDIPVMMVTGVADVFEDFISSRKQVPPPEGYIHKPIKEEKYLGKIKELLA